VKLRTATMLLICIVVSLLRLVSVRSNGCRSQEALCFVHRIRAYGTFCVSSSRVRHGVRDVMLLWHCFSCDNRPFSPTKPSTDVATPLLQYLPGANSEPDVFAAPELIQDLGSELLAGSNMQSFVAAILRPIGQQVSSVVFSFTPPSSHPLLFPRGESDHAAGYPNTHVSGVDPIDGIVCFEAHCGWHCTF
jgi:hypothetical protein